MPFASNRKVISRFTLAALAGLGCSSTGMRKFPDRPVAWSEHDQEPIAAKPNPSAKYPVAAFFTDDLLGPLDRALSLRPPMPAADVNALDEVPCSTWYCPRNHLWPMTPEAVAAGPRMARPRPPFTIVAGKDVGATPGALVVDASGRKFLFKFDVAGLLGMATGAEIVGTRLMHAAGWHVPGSRALDIDPDDLLIGEGATYKQHGFRLTPFGRAELVDLLARLARTPEGRLRAAAVAWIPGEPLGPMAMAGRRLDDPNDRIFHEHRRSLRASWLLFAWLDVADAGPFNTLDVWVQGPGQGRRFVKHYFIDFGAGLGSWTKQPKSPEVGRERWVDPERGLKALVSLGAWRRRWQGQERAWRERAPGQAAIGWLEIDGWDPTAFRTHRRCAAHAELTDRDAYWGAKVITSFSDDQLRAAVAQAGWSAEAASLVEKTLRYRRDRIGRVYLARVTALEDPRALDTSLCFVDEALRREAVRREDLSYEWEVAGASGKRLAHGVLRPTSDRTCLELPAGRAGYRIATVRFVIAGRRAKAARVHMAWRPAEGRFVVVGLERDE